MLKLMWAALLIALYHSISSFTLPRFAVPAKEAPIAVLITGCGSGLGADLVRLLLEDYDEQKVFVFAGVKKETDFKALKGFKNQDRLIPLLLDVANPSHIENAAKTIQQSGLPLYGIVNNAGRGSSPHNMQDTPAPDYLRAIRDVMEVNIFGLTELTATSIELLKTASTKLGSARIVNVGSLLGLVAACPSGGAYCTSKHALEALTAVWRYELQPLNISVSVIEPGFFKTNMCRDSFCSDPPSVCSKIVLRALFDTQPLTRYQCASVFGLPASFLPYLVQIVPDHIVDAILRQFEKLDLQAAPKSSL